MKFSTFLREGDENSPFSSKRLFGFICVVAGVLAGFVALVVISFVVIAIMKSEKDMQINIWLTITILGPMVIFLIFAALFSYFATKKDIDETIQQAAEIVRTSKAGEK